MILKQLNLGYFTNQLGLDSFNLFKSTYKSICQDGHFDSNINDKEVAALLFEQSMPDNFFESKSNLISFCHALPDLTQRKILVDLGIQMLDELRWDIQTSTYFVNILELNSKFSLKVKNQQFEFLESVIEYDKPEVVFKSLKDYQSGVFFPVYDYISQTPLQDVSFKCLPDQVRLEQLWRLFVRR